MERSLTGDGSRLEESCDIADLSTAAYDVVHLLLLLGVKHRVANWLLLAVAEFFHEATWPFLLLVLGIIHIARQCTDLILSLI